MASTINATTSGIVTIGDSVATLSLQTGGNTAVAIDTAQIVSLSKSLALLGSTSGSVTIAAPAVAGSTTITLPATSGTLLQSGTAVTVAQGGTGLTSTPANGALDIGNGTGFTRTTLTAGTNVTITNGAGAITIAASGGGSPGGSTTQVQYNNGGAFGGISGFTTDGTRVTASTTIGVGGATPSTSGSGITFPATQSSSTDVNTLDDYEEGTWTPAYGASFTGTYAANGQVGRYTKVGRFVCVYAWLQASTISGSGSLTVTGLPFAPVTATNYNPGGVIFNAGNWGTNTPFALDGAGGTSFNMKYRATANGSIDTNNSAVSDMASNCFMRVSVVYETAT